MLSEQNRYEAEKKYSQKLRGFFIHLVVYVFVIAMIVILKIGASSSIPLVLLVGAGWGLAVTIHGIVTLVKDPVEPDQ